MPHPANFSLHKLIIFQRRQNPEKTMKDIDAAVKILNALVEKNESDTIKTIFKSVPQKWQKKIIRGLEEIYEKEILKILIE